MIFKFIWWLFVTIIGLALIIVLLPLLIIIVVVLFIIGIFSRSTFRIWTSRARAGAQAGANTVRSKISEHAPGSMKTSKPGQRKSKVIDADVVDIK